MSQRNTNHKIYWLTLALGITILATAFILRSRNEDAYYIISTFGSLIAGLATAWLFEFYLSKRDNRKDIDNIFKEINIKLEFMNYKQELLPDEKHIAIFRKKLYAYWRSYSKKRGGYFWNSMVFNFSDITIKGKLIDFDSMCWDDAEEELIPSRVELIRSLSKDMIYITERRKDSEDPLTLFVFPPNLDKSYIKTNYGVYFHDDWDGRFRISPAILSWVPLTKNNDHAVLTTEEGNKLYNMWKDSSFQEIPILEKP